MRIAGLRWIFSSAAVQFVLVSTSFRTYARVTLLANIVVILWGAYVRASGSGAGCGDHWPACDGVLIPASPSISTVIEFVHRVTSGLALLFVVGLFAQSRRTFASGHPARSAAAAALALIVIEALIGALIVRASLFGGNATAARAATIALHSVNTMALLAALSLSHWYSGNSAPLLRGRVDRIGVLMLIGFAGWLLLGATGALGSLSRSLYPAASVVESLSREFAPDAPLLLRLRSLHPLVAGTMGVFMAGLAWLVHRRMHDRYVQQLAISMTVIFCAQSVLGLLNVVSVVPTLTLQLTHLLLMDVLWLCFVQLFAMQRTAAMIGSVLPSQRVAAVSAR